VRIGKPRRSAFRPFIWLFVSLALLALLSAPGATHDEMFHATNIWCGQGQRLPYCSDIRVDIEHPSARVNFDFLRCQRNVYEPLECPSDNSGVSYRSINPYNLYPSLPWSKHATPHSFVLSWFVVPSFEGSLILTRVASAAIVVLLLGILAQLLPNHHQKVLFLVIILVLPSTGYFLMSSINPSSWTIFGTGFAWIALHAALSSEAMSLRRRWGLIGVCVLCTLMALGSRWDAWGFVMLALSLVGMEVAWNKYRRFRKATLVIAVVAPPTLWFSFAKINPISPRLFDVLVSHTDEQPNNAEFLTTYLLNGTPNALEALGTLPTTTLVRVPDLVFFVNVIVLVTLLYLSRTPKSRSQIGGTLVALFTMSVMIMAQVALIDNRDNEGIEPRYSLPLLAFAVGWWFLHAAPAAIGRILLRLTALAWVITASFGLTALIVVERFADVQTAGIRFIPEGPDQWWWSSLPVGPNTVTILCTLSFAMFLHKAVALMTGDEDNGPTKNSEIGTSEASVTN